MKVSKVIQLMEAIVAEYGDIPVSMLTDTPDGLFHFDDEFVISVIGRPIDEYSNKEEQICAVAWGNIFGSEPGDDDAADAVVMNILRGKREID
jgi:hypothetical protein